MIRTPTKEQVLEAFKNFDNGARPEKSGAPTRYWIEHPNTQRLYPLKMIWGLATGRSHNDFTSSVHLRKKFNELGFDWVDKNAIPSAEIDFQNAVAASRTDTPDARHLRLKHASAQPTPVLRRVIGFRRNPDVVAERLQIAQGRCEICKEVAPFKRKKDGTPFLEVHHVKPLSDGGEDTVANTLAPFPNCHRRVHFG